MAPLNRAMERRMEIPPVPTDQVLTNLVESPLNVNLVDGHREIPPDHWSAILDSGAVEYNYILYKIVNHLNSRTSQIDKPLTVATASGHVTLKRFVIIPNLLITLDNIKYNLKNQTFLILQLAPVNVIIGLQQSENMT